MRTADPFQMQGFHPGPEVADFKGGELFTQDHPEINYNYQIPVPKNDTLQLFSQHQIAHTPSPTEISIPLTNGLVVMKASPPEIELSEA